MVIIEYSWDGINWINKQLTGYRYCRLRDTETNYVKYDLFTKSPKTSKNRFFKAITDGFAAFAKSWNGEL